MTYFMFTLDDDPTVHAAAEADARDIYCEATSEGLHVAHASEGPRVTCLDCRAAMVEEWLHEITEGKQKVIVLHDGLGAAVLEHIAVQQSDAGDYFVAFTMRRTGSKGDNCYYRAARFFNWLIDSNARFVEPNN